VRVALGIIGSCVIAGGVLIAVPVRTTLGFERIRLRTDKLGRAGVVVAVGLALIVVSNFV
jgi:hypothetical protein